MRTRIGRPVEYDGYRFRSLLEARWALFFNELGVPFSYEPEVLGDEESEYLPDFFIDVRASALIDRRGEQSPAWHDRGMLVEVKYERLDEDEEYKASLAARSGYPVLVLVGQPAIGPHRVIFHPACGQTKLRFSWALCPDCLEPGLVYPWATLAKTYLQLNCCEHELLRSWDRRERKHRLLNASKAVRFMSTKAKHEWFETWE